MAAYEDLKQLVADLAAALRDHHDASVYARDQELLARAQRVIRTEAGYASITVCHNNGAYDHVALYVEAYDQSYTFDTGDPVADFRHAAVVAHKYAISITTSGDCDEFVFLNRDRYEWTQDDDYGFLITAKPPKE